MTPVIWTSGASAELQDLFSRLEDYEDGFGVRLLGELEKSLSLLTTQPGMGSYFEKPVRKWVVSGRYGLIYCSEPRGLVILSIVDMRSDLEPLRMRLREWYERK